MDDDIIIQPRIFDEIGVIPSAEEYNKIKKIRKQKELDKKVFIYSSPTWRDKEQA